MIIEKIRLVNIKSFSDQEISFSRGINIIAGPNGSGKSTIIEAVGLALFDAWPQKFKEGRAYVGFLRKGTHEGVIKLTVNAKGRRFHISCNLGERKRKDKEPTIEYERILSDESGREIANSGGNKTDFQKKIHDMILGDSRIEDERLFNDIIGAEQGSFDAPFTQTELQRRALFEKILGIEDFQRFEKQFYALVRFQEKRVEILEEKTDLLTSAPEELKKEEAELDERNKALVSAIENHTAAAREVEEARKVADDNEVKRKEWESAQSALTLAREKAHNAENALRDAERLRAEALRANEELATVKAGYHSYNEAEEDLKKQRALREERDKLQKSHDAKQRTHEKEAIRIETERKNSEDERARLTEEIQQFGEKKIRLNEEIGNLREEFKTLSKQRDEKKREFDFISRVRDYARSLRDTRNALEKTGTTVANLKNDLRAIEEDGRKLTETLLETPVTTYVSPLHDESEILFGRVSTAETVEAESGTLDEILAGIEEDHRKIGEQTLGIQTTLDKKEEEGRQKKKSLIDLDKEENLRKAKLADVEKKSLKALSDLETETTSWSQEQGQFEEKIKAYTGIEDTIVALERKKTELHPAFERYLWLSGEVAKLEAREKDYREKEKILATLQMELRERETDFAAKERSYSEEAYTLSKARLDECLKDDKEASNRAQEWRTRTEEQSRRVEEAKKRTRDFETLNADLISARSETAFYSDLHRHVVKALAQRIGASIVESVSVFANELYAKIAPEQHAELRWDPHTYGIELCGNGTIIRGKELSGGQLMGVSLAVKLALIKWYSQCRIGLLDEPTTHLDRQTRQHLASVIQGLDELTVDGSTWFDQLFVISHEESFSGAGHRTELVLDDRRISTVAAVE